MDPNSSSEGGGVNLFLDGREGATSACISAAVERVFRVVRRVGCRLDDTRPLAVDRRGARELIVEVAVDVDFVVTAVMMLVSLPSSSDSGGGEGITFRLRLGDDCTGLETGTADADRRFPAVEVRVDLTMVAGLTVELMEWLSMLIRVLE